MHPIISAYLRYKRCADYQLSYHDPAFGSWITRCVLLKSWLDELMAECVR